MQRIQRLQETRRTTKRNINTNKEMEIMNGWPCDYCGELDPDFNSVCEKCYEIHKEEIKQKAIELMHKTKRKRKIKNDQSN